MPPESPEGPLGGPQSGTIHGVVSWCLPRVRVERHGAPNRSPPLRVQSYGVSPTIWVAELEVSAATAHKLASKHGLDADEVRRSIVCVSGLRFRWHHHPVRGRRVLVQIDLHGRTVLAVLYPTSGPFGDAWTLGSAYPLSR